jgi:hypothetical protein
MHHIRTLHAAALELVSHLPLKQRLINAYSKHLQTLEVSLLPSSAAYDWGRLHVDLTCHRPLYGETAIQATVRKLSQAELESLAARILTLYRDAGSLGALQLVDDSRPEEVSPQTEMPLGELARA